MSAPPIGMIMSTPSTSAMMVMSQKSSALPDITRPTMKNTSARPSAMLMMWRKGRMIGLPLMRADNFRNAITEPVNVKAPVATSTAAMPTSEWNAATSSGIDVIGTRRAITAPTLPPMAMPRITRTQATPSAGGWPASVVAIAIAIPIMPKKLPWRDVAGLDSPRSDRMNSTPATRYNTAERLAFISGPQFASPRGACRSLGLLPVHPEHALGDKEAAENIHAGKSQRDEAEAACPTAAGGNRADADREQRADNDHRGDRVGHRHQRRVPRRGPRT